MDDLGVAGAGDGADGLGGFEHDDLAALERERAGDRETDNTGADHGAFDLFAHRALIGWHICEERCRPYYVSG